MASVKDQAFALGFWDKGFINVSQHRIPVTKNVPFWSVFALGLSVSLLQVLSFYTVIVYSYNLIYLWFY